jgi:hypothetical protein
MPTPPKVLIALNDVAKAWDKVEVEIKGNNGLPNGPKEKIEKLVSTMKRSMDELEKLSKEALKQAK